MDVGKITAEVRADLSKFDSDLNQAKSTATSAASDIESKFRGVGSAIGSAVQTGVAAAAVAFAGVATAGVKSYMDIESAASDAASKMDLSAIAQQSGTTTAAAFTNVKEHVMSLADELGQLNTNAFDPTQIAQACANLAAQGFDVATASAKDLAPVLTLATATNYDLADSADMAMSTMNTFGMGVSDLGHIADVYTTACGASAAGMGDLNYALQQAGPVASVANVSFETLTACLETFSQSNIKGEKAGTALRGAINTLITPTKSLTDGLASIGLSMDQVDPRSNDFVDVLAKMKTQADASGQGLSAFTSIFGAEGGLIYKLASSTDQIETFRNGLLDCDGAAEQMAKNMLDNLGGSMDAAMGAASSLAYKIGGDLAPTLKATFDWFSSSGAPAIRRFIEAIEKGDWAGAGEKIGLTFDRIKSAISGLVTGAGMTLFGAGMLALIPAAASMSAGVIASTVTMVATSIGSIATMVAGHITGYARMVATTASSWILMKAENLAGWLAIKATALSSMALTVETTLAGYAKMAATAAANMGIMATGVAGKFASMALGAAASLLTMAAGAAASFGGMALNAALRLEAMTASVIGGYIKMAISSAASVAGMVATTLSGFAAMATGAVASVVGMAASFAAPLAVIAVGLAGIGLAADPSKFTTLGKIGSDALNGLKSVASDCWAAIQKGDFSAVATRLKTAFSSSVDYIKNINWSGVGSDIVKAVGVGWDTLKDYAAKAGAAAMDALKAAFAFGSDIAKGLYEDFENIDWSGVWDSLVSAWDSAIDTLSDVGSTILGYFDSIDWGTVGFKIGQAIRDAIAKLSDIGTTIWNYLTSTDWSGAGSSITEKIRSGLETLKDYWEEFRAGFLVVDWATTASDIATKLKDGFKKVTDWASSIIDGIKKDWSAWVSSGGPANLGTDLAKAVLKGAADLGKWIYDSVASWWRSNGSSLGGVISNAIDFAKLALRTAYDFVTGFANTILTAGKGTIGAAILEIIGGTMNSAWDGAGDSLIEKAAGWREEAESIFSGEDFDVDVATTYTGAGNPKDLDGSTVSVNVNYVATSGRNLAPSTSPEGGASVAATSGKLYVHLASAQAGESSWVEATEWAKEMGKAGNTTADFLEIINGMKTAGTKLLPSTIEKLTTAFTEGQAEYNASQTRANAATVAAATEAANIETEGAKAETATETSSIRDIMAEAKSTSSGVMKSIMDTATAASSAMSSAAEKILSGSQTAANAIALGGQVASNFTTQAGQAVQIGLSSTGREIAVIGSVAQQNVTAAGGELYSKVTVAGSNLVSASNQAASIGIAAENQKATTSQDAGTTWLSNVTTSGNTITGAATTFKAGIDTATTGFVTGVGTAAGALVSTVGSVAASLLGGKLSIGGKVSSGSSGSSTNTFTDCFFEGFTDSCTNMNVNALKYTAPNGTVSYINPLTYHSTGGTTGNSGNTGYQLPAIFRAKGGLIDDGPELAIIGESGSEMVLPHDITQTILDLTRGGVEGDRAGGANTITPSDVYLDGRKVGQIAFKYGTESMRRKGMSIR